MVGCSGVGGTADGERPILPPSLGRRQQLDRRPLERPRSYGSAAGASSPSTDDAAQRIARTGIVLREAQRDSRPPIERRERSPDVHPASQHGGGELLMGAARLEEDEVAGRLGRSTHVRRELEVGFVHEDQRARCSGRDPRVPRERRQWPEGTARMGSRSDRDAPGPPVMAGWRPVAAGASGRWVRRHRGRILRWRVCRSPATACAPPAPPVDAPAQGSRSMRRA